jgi:hypothetical protein
MLGAAALAAAAPAQEAQRIELAPGATEATVEGAVSGYAAASYLVAAGAGQEMAVTLASPNPQVYFNIYRPGDVPGESSALHVGARQGLAFRAKLSEAGDYLVQVFLMRAAARRGEAGAYALTVAVAGEAAAAPDLADGLAGGPDFWQVTGLAAGGTLDLRAEPGTRSAVLGTVPADTRLRNRGCRVEGTQRWCQVESTGEPVLTGWVAGRYLREAVGP